MGAGVGLESGDDVACGVGLLAITASLPRSGPRQHCRR